MVGKYYDSTECIKNEASCRTRVLPRHGISPRLTIVKSITIHGTTTQASMNDVFQVIIVAFDREPSYLVVVE